jgi:magnesium-transporting ATPase (P-type)
MAIKELKRVNIPSYMITGDNHLTALAIGLECNILEKQQEMVYISF